VLLGDSVQVTAMGVADKARPTVAGGPPKPGDKAPDGGAAKEGDKGSVKGK
jgi:hypothetical protein